MAEDLVIETSGEREHESSRGHSWKKLATRRPVG